MLNTVKQNIWYNQRAHDDMDRKAADLQRRLRKAITTYNKATQAVYGHNRRVAGGVRITKEVIIDVINAANGFCCWCNQPIKKGHIDHIQPVSRGGGNQPSNLVYICSTCNLSKHDKTVLEFMIWRKRRQI